MNAGTATLRAQSHPLPTDARKPVRGWLRAVSYAIVLLIAVGLCATRLSGPIDFRYDGAVYYVLGTSLAQGEGYRIISEPGAPEGVQYPPALPALIALHQLILGTNDIAVVGPALRWTYIAMYLAYAAAMLTLARRFAPPVLAVFGAVLCLGQVNAFLSSDMLFTELPFMLTTVGFALVLSSRRLQSRLFAREGSAFVLASIAFLLRAAGIGILAAWVGEALFRRQWRLVVIRAVLAAVPFVGWQMHVSRVLKSEEYRHPAYEYQRAPYQFYNVTYAENMALADPFRPEKGKANVGILAQRAVANFGVMLSAIGESVSEHNGFWRWLVRAPKETNENRGSFSHQLGRLPLFCLTAFTAVGLWVLARRRDWVIVLLIACSVALVCSTPWPGQFQRYLTPVAPFLTVALVLGMSRARQWFGTLRAPWALRWNRVLIGFCAMLVVLQVFSMTMVFRQRRADVAAFAAAHRANDPDWFYFDKTWLRFNEATDWIKAHAKPGEIVATTSPHYVSLLTRLRAVMPPMEANVSEAQRLLDTVPVTWVIVDEMEFLDTARVYARPVVEGATDRWELAHRFGQTTVYRRIQGAEPAPGST